jgi:hypothetical protein
MKLDLHTHYYPPGYFETTASAIALAVGLSLYRVARGQAGVLAF